MRVENWDGETTVVDEDVYAIEVPVMDGGTMLCPHGTCRKQFRQVEVLKLLQHAQSAHSVSYTIDKTCPTCKETFEVTKATSHRTYCCRACFNKRGERRSEIIADIRTHLDTESETKRLSKDELREVHRRLDQRPTATTVTGVPATDD